MGLAGLVFGTGLDSSLFKEIEIKKNMYMAHEGKKNFICETLLVEEPVWITHFAVGGGSAPSFCVPLLLSVLWLAKEKPLIS